MEELKVIIDMIASLPQLALWVLVGFWAYKVIVIGSIYGTVKFIAQKVYEVLSKPKRVELTFKGMVVNEDVGNYLVGQISRIASTKGIKELVQI